MIANEIADMRDFFNSNGLAEQIQSGGGLHPQISNRLLSIIVKTFRHLKTPLTKGLLPAPRLAQTDEISLNGSFTAG